MAYSPRSTAFTPSCPFTFAVASVPTRHSTSSSNACRGSCRYPRRWLASAPTATGLAGKAACAVINKNSFLGFLFSSARLPATLPVVEPAKQPSRKNKPPT